MMNAVCNFAKCKNYASDSAESTCDMILSLCDANFRDNLICCQWKDFENNVRNSAIVYNANDGEDAVNDF